MRLLKKVSGKKLPPHSKAEFFERIGSAHQRLGQFHLANRFLKSAFSSYQKSKDRFGQASVALQLGDVHRQIEKFLEAKKWYEKAQTTIGKGAGATSKNSLMLAIDAAMGKALCLRGMGKLREAARWFDDLVKVYKREKDPAGLAYTRWALGTTQRFLGDFQRAKKNLEASLKDYQKLRDANGMAYAKCGLGGTLRMMGLAKKSGQNYKSASQYFSKVGDEFGLAYSSCGQANAHRMQGKFGGANPFFRRAISLYRQLGLKGPLGFVLWSQAQQDISLKKFSSAKRNLVESGRLFKSVNDDRGLVYVELGWGELFHASNPSRGTQHFKKAYKMAKKQALLFEMIHARRRFSLIPSLDLYSKLGADPKAFKKYKALP